MFEELHFKEAPRIVVEPPGPKANRILDEQKTLESNAVLYPRDIPLVLDAAKGATIRDVDGNIYIDFFSGISVLNFGHSNPYILDKAIDQLKNVSHILDFPNIVRIEFVKKLVGIAPSNLRGRSKVLFGSPSGGDAIEAAIKLSKYNTGRYSVIAFEGSYHGQSTMSLSLTSIRKYKELYPPLGPLVYFVPYPNPYRCPFKVDDPKTCSELSISYLENMLENPASGIMSPAAIIVEPIQGEGGVVIPPDGFLEGVEKLARKNGVIFIVDEIQSGMCRTGKWFACEHWNISPDIITVAKSVGGVGLPLSAIIYRKELDTWPPGAHTGTFRGNVVAMAAGSAAIDFAKNSNLLDYVTKLGDSALGFLRDLVGETKYIGDVRGKGLMIAIEFVKDRKSKEPYKKIVSMLQSRCFKEGLIVWKAGGYGNIIRFLPPLVITEELMFKGLEIFGDVVKRVERLIS
jgi:diaminobutyrate-2-oxoglutarate transaminase